MSQVQLKNPGRPTESVLSYKDCLMSGGSSKSVIGLQRASREGPQAIVPTVSESEETMPPPDTHSDTPSLREVQLEEMDRRLKEVDEQLEEVSHHHTSLVEQAQLAFSELRKILEQKEKAVLDTYKAVYDSKCKQLTKYRNELVSLQQSEVSSANDSPPLPAPPILCGGTLCGFVPEMTNLTQATASLILEHRDELPFESETKASVIGSINSEGIFWVRILPQDSAVQDIMLLNLSNTICVELSLAPPPFLRPGEAKVGDLCCALYTEDQRWYRGRIVSLLERNQAKVFFVDYGNVETILLTNLCPLHPKFLVYPFQMVQCCFSNLELVYEREVRWKFTDLTHGSDLTVKVVDLLPRNISGRLHRVQLVNQSKRAGQPFEVGTMITTMTQPSTKPQGANSILYRDVRYAGKVSGSSEFQAETVVEEEGYFTQSSDGPLNTSGSGDALPSSALNSSEEEKATPQSGVAIKVTTPTPNYSQVAGRASSSSPVPPREVKVLSPRDREVKSLPPPDHREPRAKVNGFSRGSSPAAVEGNSQVVLEKDQKYDVFVTTPLLKHGTFWLQLATTEEPAFLEMVERLQVCCTEEPPTPVFFSPGDYCAAQFSEDECWYRARVEEVVKNKFKVRYVDFGNCELRERDSLMALGSEFKVIPFQAVRCSIATDDHTSFTEKEIEKFNTLTDSQKLSAKVLGEEPGNSAEADPGKHELNKPLKVELSLGTCVSIKEAVCAAAASLSLSGVNELTSASNWADTMDEIQSPKNDGVFTIPGQESRSQSHTPTPSSHLVHKVPPPQSLAPESPPRRSTSPSPARNIAPSLPLQNHVSSSPPRNTFPPSHPRNTVSPSPSPSRSIVPPSPPNIVTSSPPPTSTMPTYSSRLRSTASPVQARKVDKAKEKGLARSSSPQNGVSGWSVARSSSVPRIQTNALAMMRRNLHVQVAENEKAKQKRVFSDQDSLASGLAQPKGMRSINQAIRNGTSFPPSGRRRKSPDPDSTQVKLFVRYMPHNKSIEEVYHLFALYGCIHTLEYHTEHKDKLYLIMDKEGGMRAVKGLDGNHLAGSPKPLSVQPYKGTTVPSPDQAELDSLPHQTCTRLFVKNIPLDRTVEDMRVMFTQYGKVLGLVPIPSRKNVIYMYMEPKGAQIAIDNLHGKAISKHSKPMIVELSNPPRSSRS